MKNFKINFKLTGFLVSLFLSLLLLILGSGNKYCLSFGFMALGGSLELFFWYNNEKMQNYLNEINQEIDNVETFEELNDMEKAYILQQLYTTKKKIEKKKKSSNIGFSVLGGVLVIVGFVALF